MRIRTWLTAGLVLSAVLVTARLVQVQARVQDEERLTQTQLAVDRLSSDTTSLLVLGQDFLLSRSPRASRQWHAVHADLSAAIAALKAGAREEPLKIGQVAEVAASLPALFAVIETLVAQDDHVAVQSRLEMLASHLVGETRRVNDIAFAMSEALALDRQARANRVIKTAIATTIGFGLLVIGLGWMISRRVLRPLALLDATAMAVQRGDLAARSSYLSKDELGGLSLTFDNMTQTLQQREAHLRSTNERLAASEASLARTRHDLQNILDAMPSQIGYWDHGLRNRVANGAYRAWFGVDPESLRGKHIRELLGETIYESNRPHLEAALAGEARTFQGSPILKPDGSGLRYTQVNYLPDIVNGEVRGVYSLVHDISELVEGRTKLADASRETQLLSSTIGLHAIFSMADRAGRIIEVNDNFCRITGYSRDDLLGQNHRIVNSGSHPAQFWVEMWRTISSGKPWRGEVCNRAKDGSLYWVDSIIAPFLDERGQVEKYISIRTDITAIKRTEQRLRASEAFLDSAGRVARVGGWQLDLQTRRVTWSDQMCRLHEVEPGFRPSLKQVLGSYPAAVRPQIERLLADAIESHKPWDIELPLITPSGRQLWVRAVGEVELEHGVAVRLIGSEQDITQRKLADELLQRANHRFHIAAEAANIAVWEFDAQTHTLDCDERMYRMYQREASAALAPDLLWADGTHPDDQQRLEATFNAALRGECEFDPEFRIVWPGGEVRHLLANAQVVRDADGTPLRMTGVSLDITVRKRAELALLETSSLLNTVLESASEVSIMATDPRGIIRVFNSGAERLTGYRRDELIGRSSSLRIHDPAELRTRAQQLGAELGREVRSALVLVEPSTLGKPSEWTYRRKNGSRVTVSLVLTAMRTDGGELLGYLGVAHDVTRQKQYEDSLRNAMLSAEQASRAKSQFLANMSHEIRTPMNAVVGLSYLLGRTALDAEQASFLAKIQLANRSLLAVINDVLDISKIEAGELMLETTAFSLRGLLDELAAVMRLQAEAKGIGFVIDVPNDLPAALVGDVTRLNQILTNLLSNAIKFTDSGNVRLTVRGLEVSSESVTLHFAVRDTGIGISPEHQARLFTPFAQADASTTRRFGGTGLGLSIVQKLAQAMGGEVGLVSSLDAGSEFWVELSFVLASPDAPALLQAPAEAGGAVTGLHGVRVLVVDDSAINLTVAQRILEHEGARVTLACNGQEALECLRAKPQGFDVVLMDVQMPVMDGHEATHRIREDLGLASLPIIALTAGALTTERERAMTAGMNEFVSKPFDAAALVRTIRRHVQVVQGQRAAPATDAPVLLGAPWPEIEGIDSADVCVRLAGDQVLFRSMLRRLLDEFCNQPVPTDLAEPAKLAAHASRMHKLRGSAGMLGAREIQQRAGDAETACRAGQAVPAMQLAQRISAHLLELQRHAAPLFEPDAAALDTPSDTGAGAEIEAGVLNDLLLLLRQHSLSALDRFTAIAPQLQRRMGTTNYQRVREHIDNLRFTDAARVLDQHRA